MDTSVFSDTCRQPGNRAVELHSNRAVRAYLIREGLRILQRLLNEATASLVLAEFDDVALHVLHKRHKVLRILMLLPLDAQHS